MADRPDIDRLADRPRRALELLAAGPDGDLGRGALADLDELVALADDLKRQRNIAYDQKRDLYDRAESAEAALAEERFLREQIEDDYWPYEWQFATAEREKRKAAEARATELEAALRDARQFVASVQRNVREYESDATGLISRIDVLAGDGGGA